MWGGASSQGSLRSIGVWVVGMGPPTLPADFFTVGWGSAGGGGEDGAAGQGSGCLLGLSARGAVRFLHNTPRSGVPAQVSPLSHHFSDLRGGPPSPSRGYSGLCCAGGFVLCCLGHLVVPEMDLAGTEVVWDPTTRGPWGAEVVATAWRPCSPPWPLTGVFNSESGGSVVPGLWVQTGPTSSAALE